MIGLAARTPITQFGVCSSLSREPVVALTFEDVTAHLDGVTFPVTIGSAASSTLQINRRGIAPTHVSITRDADALVAEAQGGVETRLAGWSCPRFVLAPLQRIELAPQLSIRVESSATLRLRPVLEELVGWTTATCADRFDDVWQAIERFLRHEHPLVLTGVRTRPESEFLVRRIYDAIFAPRPLFEAPACPALDELGHDDVVYVPARVRWNAYRAALRSRAWVIVCAAAEKNVPLLVPRPVHVQLWQDRPEVERRALVRSYSANVVHALGRGVDIDADALRAIESLADPTLHGLAVAARRGTALLASPGVTAAARVLGLSHVALSRWVARRRAIVARPPASKLLLREKAA